MKKIILITVFVVFFQSSVFALSCPTSSNERRKEYNYNGVHLVCDYQNGFLQSRFQQNAGETESVDYYSNGMPREYNLRTTNMGGGFYASNKKYNSSGMMVNDYLISGNSGYECTYAGRGRMKCVSFENGVGYESSVEYVSQYEWN